MSQSASTIDSESPSPGAAGLPAGILPVLVRIAGLPGMALSSLGSPPLHALSSRLAQLQKALRQTQSDLADLISLRLPGFSAAERRVLLAIKRDCFNHRDITKHLEGSYWRLIEELAPGLADRQLSLLKDLEVAEEELRELFARELQRELEVIYGHASNPRFLRGLVLSSAEVVQALRLDRRPSQDGKTHQATRDRRQRKLDLTLLRFVTRAAAKLSPNSTLTTLALGRIEPEVDESLRVLTGGRTEERSRLHLDRIYVDQLQELLLFAPEVRALCRVSINDTLQATGPRALLWIRPSRWQVDEKGGRLLLTPLSVAKAQLDEELIAAVRETLGKGADSYQEVSRTLHTGVLDRLIEIGLLQLLPPWAMSSALPGEKVILDVLRSQALSDPLLCEFRQSLSRLLELEAEFPISPHPDRCCVEMRQQLDQLRELACRFPTLEKRLTLPSVLKANRLFHESVFRLQRDPATVEQAATVALGKKPLEDVYRAARALHQFSDFFNHRHDLLHALEHFWRAELSGEQRIPVLDFFRKISPIWKEYVAFDREQHNTLMTTFNPNDLPPLRELATRRAQLYHAVQSRLSKAEDGCQISCEEMEGLVAEIPDRYRPQAWPGVLAQPLQKPTGLWVLNRILEGTGRYSSRYISALPWTLGKAFADRLSARAHLRLEGENADLLDLMFVRGGASEVHHPQTPWLLELPGDKVDVSARRRARLSELHLHFEKHTGQLALRNGNGQRLLPVHLTSLNHSFLPSILRFLSVFGPYEIRQTFPRPPRVEHGCGCSVYERVTCGRLVVSRKRWEFGPEAMAELASQAESSASYHFYLAAQAWRERYSIPDEVYYYERIHSPREGIYHYKPQFMDLTSPLTTQLLASLLKSHAKRHIIDEALPARHQNPLTPEGPRAMEVQLEGVAFQHSPLIPTNQSTNLEERNAQPSAAVR